MQLKPLFKSTFQDNEQTRKSLFFKILLISLLIVLTITLLIDCIIFPDLILRWIIVLIFILTVGLVLLFLNRRGYNKLASVLFICFFILIIFGLTWTSGGIKSTAILYLTVVVFASGLLLSWRAVVIAAITVIMGVFGIFLIDHFGMLPVSVVYYNNISSLTNLSVIIIILGMLQYLTVEKLNKALEKAQQELELRKITEEDLLIREIFLKSIFENANDAIIIMKDGLFIDCNYKTLELFGCEKSQIINQTPSRLSPEYQEDGTLSDLKALHYINQALDGTPQRFEWMHCQLDGSQFYAEVSLNRLDVNGVVVVQAIVRDVSERKKSEAIIREKERHIRAIFDLSFEFIGLLTPEGILLEVNNTACEFANVIPKDVIGKPFWETPWWNHSPMVQQKLKTAIADAAAGKTVTFETTHFDPSRNLHSIDFLLKPVKDERGKVVLLIPEGRDVTDLRKTFLMLEQEKIFTDVLINTLPGIYFLYDITGGLNSARLIRFNEEHKHLLGYSQDELYNAHSLLFFKPEDHHFIVDKMLNPDEIRNNSIEFNLLHKKGHTIPCLIQVGIIKREDRVYLMGTGIDITERKLSEKRMYNVVLLTEEKEKEQFAKELHDGLGPILSTCKIYLSHLNEKLNKNDDLFKVSDQVLKLLNDGLLSIKEISNNLSPHILKNYGLAHAIKSFINNIKIVSKVDFSLECPDIKGINEVYEFTVYRILTELVNNSLKYSGANKISISFEQTEETLRVIYKDDGKGFDYMQTIDQKKGFGLLNIENRIKKLNGDFKYLTSPGNGVSVQIVLNF